MSLENQLLKWYLINKRDLAKKEKNFDLADDIRNELNEMGIEIKDTNDGTSWNVK